MRYRLLAVLLTLGAITGYASGFASLRHRWHGASCHDGGHWGRAAALRTPTPAGCPPCSSADSAPPATPR